MVECFRPLCNRKTPMKKLLISSRNDHKIREIRAILGRPGLEILSAADVPGLPDVEEDGGTFAENALKKARELARASGLWTIADDSGLEVDALHGEPGVHSARYAGEHGRDAANNAKLLGKLEGVSDRGAQFHSAVALVAPDGREWLAEGVCRGTILTEGRGTGGFGYDPLFVPEGYDRTFAELGSEVKNRISHRARALAEAKRIFPLNLPPSPMHYDIPGFSSVSSLSLSCDEPGAWRIDASRDTAPDGAELLRLRLSADGPVPPPSFDVSLVAQQTGARWIWNSRDDVPTLPPEWGGSMQTDVARGTPILVVGGTDGRSKLSVACSEATRLVDWRYGLCEEDAFLHVRLRFFGTPEAPIEAWEAAIRLDAAPRFWSDAVRVASEWVCARPDYAPMPAPEAAFEPLYSTWYGYHQDVYDKPLEEEFARAAALGMRTLIVDDGWQTDDTGRGYAFCGDWEPSPRRFPDLRAHVERVHALGMRYMLWFSVPFIGEKSRAFARFQGKFLYQRAGLGAYILDPRFPEVREFLAGTFEHAVRDWGLDGLKLDFIDNMAAPRPDPAEAENYAGRDIRSVPAAVHALMTEIRRRLTALRPDILIEFRQTYMGPAIRSFGNMIRAADVPGDPLRNRARTARLRLTSGGTAVHADMLEWNPQETPEQAAQQILSVLYSVIQYSMRLDRLPEAHLRMMRHWIGWTCAHRAALLHGTFRAHSPELGYPLLEGASETERVATVYAADLVVRGGPTDRELWVVNATDVPSVLLELAVAPASVEVFDTFGDRQDAADPLAWRASSPIRVPVPVSGLLHLRW